MDVLLVNSHFQLGGAETVVRQLWSRIPDTRMLVAESISSKPEVMYPHFLSRLNHSRLHSYVEKSFPMCRWTERRFSKLQNDPADVIHVHNFHGTYASVEALAALARTKRVVWTFHGLWGVTGGCDHPKGCTGYLRKCGCCPQLGLWPIGTVDRTAEELSRKETALAGLPLQVVAPSRYFLEVIRSSRIGKSWTVHHIPNGIDPTRFKPAQTQSCKPRVLIVNRDFRDAHKGFSTVRAALDLISPESVKLTFVGVQSSWAAQQVSQNFQRRDLGYIVDREKMALLYGESDIFLFASPAENFPCVILEAMASGCCVVATPSGGVMEQITDGHDGFLAEAISGPALAAALARALEFPERTRTIGKNARDTVIGKFSEDQMIDAHARLYQSLVA